MAALSIDEVRKLLGEFGTLLSDAEVVRCRDDAEQIADLVFDWWLEKRNSPTQGP